MKISVVQPAYFSGAEPDGPIADFLMNQLDDLTEGELIVLPEYSNAGGLDEAEKEIAATARVPAMLQKAPARAKEAKAYVAINVLEQRDGQLKNTTYLFGKDGQPIFLYDKQHLPVSEIAMDVVPGCPDGRCRCVCEADGLRFAFLTCYDVYFNEQIEHIARFKPDIILVPGCQRGERTDIIEAQAKLMAFRCNAYVARASYSMGRDDRGGNSMIVSPDGTILNNLGGQVGRISCEVNPTEKYTRPAGYGGPVVRNDDFINAGICPEAFAD